GRAARASAAAARAPRPSPRTVPRGTARCRGRWSRPREVQARSTTAAQTGSVLTTVAECAVAFAIARKDFMSFTVTNRKTGTTFSVKDDETILDAGLANSTVFPYSCRGGTCGTCKARLVQGRIHHAHPPAALSAEELEQGYVLLCQAVPETDVEIEATELAASAEIRIKILPCRVSAMDKAAHDVMILHLKLPANQPFDYLAGQ